MKKEIKFSLVFRDMWQSAGKYVPRVDQLVKVAPAIIEMGCFARVETNGGGFEQVNLLFGENPNKAVREWTKPFHEAGIQTHKLDRHWLCTRCRNDFPMFALHHPFTYPYRRILHEHGFEAYQGWCRRNLHQGYGRHRTSGFPG